MRRRLKREPVRQARKLVVYEVSHRVRPKREYEQVRRLEHGVGVPAVAARA